MDKRGSAYPKKIVVNEDPALWNGYVQMMTLFSRNGFGNLPAKIEWIGLLSGKRRVYYPRNKDVAGAVDYMEWFAAEWRRRI